MFQFRRFPTYTYGFNARWQSIALPGFPIRKSPDQRLFAPPRSLSQLVTSFIGSWCQGIPLALFIAWPIENSRSLARSRLWIMQASQIVEIVIVTHHLFRCCSTIKYLTLSVSFQTQKPLCCLTYHFSSHCSVFKVQVPTSFEVRLKYSIP